MATKNGTRKVPKMLTWASHVKHCPVYLSTKDPPITSTFSWDLGQQKQTICPGRTHVVPPSGPWSTKENNTFNNIKKASPANVFLFLLPLQVPVGPVLAVLTSLATMADSKACQNVGASMERRCKASFPFETPWL